jgi:hypothetical protein
MSNSSTVLYGLECGHAAPGPDTLVSGVLRCAWHRDDQKIVSVIVYEWCAKCRGSQSGKPCTFIRWSGLSVQNARLLAQAHSRNNPDHIVGPEYRKNPNAERTAGKMKDWKVKSSNGR